MWEIARLCFLHRNCKQLPLAQSLYLALICHKNLLPERNCENLNKILY